LALVLLLRSHPSHIYPHLCLLPLPSLTPLLTSPPISAHSPPSPSPLSPRCRDVSSNFLNGTVPPVPAGRNLDFKYFTNCLNTSANPELADQMPKDPAECTKFYNILKFASQLSSTSYNGTETVQTTEYVPASKTPMIIGITVSLAIAIAAAEEYLADREKTPLMVDPKLEGNFDLDELYALCDIARTCVQDQAVNRPTIRDVAKALVENLGHATSSYAGSHRDSASIMSSSQSDATSLPSSSYPSTSESSEFSYQNYSETLHWTPGDDNAQSTKSGSVALSKGAKGDHLPVPVPRRPDFPPDEA
ncbi:unnamed protein product, partial [Closterium sp. NIES-54]